MTARRGLGGPGSAEPHPQGVTPPDSPQTDSSGATVRRRPKRYDPIITVCSRCLRACCWQGEFMCEDAYSAGIVNRRVSTLIRRHGQGELEHPDWWNRHLDIGHETLLTADDLKALGITSSELLELA